MKLYVVRSKSTGEFFRAMGRNSSGSGWVKDLENAKLKDLTYGNEDRYSGDLVHVFSGQEARNIDLLVDAMNDFGITDPMAQIGILSVIGKETNYIPKSETSYSNTSPSRIRHLFGKRVSHLSDAEINQLKKDDEKFYNLIYANTVGNGKNLTLMDGPSVKEFENKVANLFGKKYGLMVNSGSSANLLALASLKLKKNSEVITPTLTFSTTVAPIYQLGLIPNFIDVEIDKFIINIDKIEKSINKNTKAMIIPNLLGNIPDYRKIIKIAKKYSLKVIEDSADTIGYSINGKNFGKYSDISTTSFYASHIVTGAGFGGMICFNDKKI